MATSLQLYYQSDFLTTLAYLMGEKTVNSSTSAPRADFIQSAIHDAYGAYPWIFARAKTTITLASNLATLPDDYDARHLSWAFAPDTAVSTDDGERLDPVSDVDNHDLVNGDRAMWVEPVPNGDGTRYVLRTKDSDLSSLYFRYQKVEPNLSTASTGTPYPNKRTIALGARTYVKLGQNPDADISQELKTFEKEIAKDIAQYQVQETRKRRRTAQGQTGRSTGDW
jgi:hypothetical protein